MSRLKVTDSAAEIPATIHVGDTVKITATARVTGIHEDIIDVTGIGQPAKSSFAPGERTYTLILIESEIE